MFENISSDPCMSNNLIEVIQQLCCISERIIIIVINGNGTTRIQLTLFLPTIVNTATTQSIKKKDQRSQQNWKIGFLALQFQIKILSSKRSVQVCVDHHTSTMVEVDKNNAYLYSECCCKSRGSLAFPGQMRYPCFQLQPTYINTFNCASLCYHGCLI